MNQNYSKGYIAITSAIIISFLLIALTTTLGFNAFFTRFNLLDSASKEQSLVLAQACGNLAILKLASNPQYQVTSKDHTIAIQQYVCNIISVAPTIKTQAAVNHAYTNLEIAVDNSFHIISWQEVPNFDP